MISFHSRSYFWYLSSESESLIALNMNFNDEFDLEDVDEHTRDVVLDRDGDACWLCGDTSTASINIAHHIHAAASKHPFPSLKDNGTIAIPHLSHPDNLLPLCPTCHTKYDSTFPEWIMVPDVDTLKQYLEHEKEDYDHRLYISQTSQKFLPRTLPSIDRTKVLYHPAILSTHLDLEMYFKSKWPKHWLGDPTTVIHRAAWHGLLDSTPVQPVRLGFGDRAFQWQRGIQPDFQILIGKLIRLWARPVPKGLRL